MINYHIFGTQDAYINSLINLISSLEGQVALVTDIGDGKATIGYGYTFNRTDNVALWTASGIALTAAELTALQNIDNAPANQKTNTALTQFTRSITKDEARQLLRQTYSQYEGPANDLSMPLSNERVALISITYNRGEAAVRAKMKDFYAAVQSGDRAEAWFQIRYNAQTANPVFMNGIANRRYKESDQFGLYDNAALSDTEAKSIYRMFTRHKTVILGTDGEPGGVPGYEDRYPPTAVNAGSQAIAQQLDTAYTYLITTYITNNADITTKPTIAWNHLQVGEDASSLYYRKTDADAGPTTLLGHGNNDLIFGESGSDWISGGAGTDVLYGGTGNDYLFGDQGDDILMGGAGDDYYFINTGDGTDQIEDKDGNNTVVINGTPVKFLIRPTGGTTWEAPDKRFTGVMVGTDLVVTETATGVSVILNKDFQNGDFGIHLLDQAPATTVFDAYNLNAYPTDDTIAYSYNGTPSDLNNIYVDSGEGNDRVYTKDGNDHLILGPATATHDNDLADAAGGNDTIEGGAGSDVLLGRSGDDALQGGDFYMLSRQAA